MKNLSFEPNRLRVASPCPVGWESMTGTARVRRCDLCELNVYNIEELTPPQVEELIRSREGRLCIRLLRRADGTVITKDCPVGFRKMRKRATALAGAILGSVLGLFSFSFGQKNDVRTQTRTWTVPAKIIIIPDRAPVIAGTVTDPNGAVIPGAKLILIPLSRIEREIVADESGTFSFTGLEPGEYEMKATAPNFEEVRFRKLAVKHNQKLNLEVTLNISGILEVMGVFVGEDVIQSLPFSVGGPSTVIKVDN